MAKYQSIIAAFACVLSLAGSAGAESVSLRDAVNAALEKNFLLQAARYEQEAASGRASAASSLYLPRLFFEERAAVTNSATRAFMMRMDQGRFSLAGDLNHPDRTTDFQSSVVVEQPLLDMTIGGTVSAAREAEAAQEHALERRRDTVAFQVYEAYLGVQRAAAHLGVADQAIVEAREHLRQAKVRTDAGAGLKYDELRISTYLAELEQQKITAENEYGLARLRLGKAMGGEGDQGPEISERLGAKPLGMTPSELEKASLANRRDLDLLRAEVARGDALIGAARGGYWPTLYGMASYQLNDRDTPLGRDNDSWVIGATLRWELFDGMRRTNELQAAKAGRDAALSYLRGLQQDVIFEVREAVARMNEASKRLEVARSALQGAEEMVRLIARRFENALATTVEMLDAGTALTRARAQLADNEANLALATARVYHSSGVFRREVLK